MSIFTNNPYVTINNQTALSALTSSAAGVVNNLLNNAQGAAGAAGSVLSGLSGALAAAGLSSGGIGGLSSGKLDSLISGASSYFASDSPARTTVNALQNRNNSAINGSNPETKIPNAQGNTTGGSFLSYPAAGAAPHYFTLTFGEYKRMDPLGNTTITTSSTITLPLPEGSGFVDNTTANWSAENLGIAGNVLQNINDVGKIKDFDQAAKNMGMDAALYAADKVISAMNSEAAGAVESVTGLAPNPAMAQLFKGVGFREFSFNWTFAPRNKQESDILDSIIQLLKQKHLPTFTGSGQAGGTSFLFNYPSIVKPAFSNAISSYLTTFKWCVLKNVLVSYAPQGIPSFYAGSKAPVMVKLQLDMQEMEYVLAQDYSQTTLTSKTAAQASGSALQTLAANFQGSSTG